MPEIKLDPKQERIVKTLEGPLFVSAGAGSGKTFTLTQRVMYALRPGSKPREQWADPNVPEAFLDSIDQVLAITFTEKAAAELKERIRSALLAEGMETEAAKVDSAWISTIHGMCARIIRAHALDLGIDPKFGVIGYADELKRAAVEHVIHRAVIEDEAGDGPYDELLAAFEVEGAGGCSSGSYLIDILMDILSTASSMVGGLARFEQVKPNASYIPLMEAYREIALTPSYVNFEAATTAFNALEVYASSERDLPALRTCYEACEKLKKRGAIEGEKPAIDIVNSERALFFAEEYLSLHGNALQQLMQLAHEVEREYKELKAADSLLDNDDLLTHAYEALTTDPLVQAEFAGKFKMVMVDEFQDTAQQQVELVRCLCGAEGKELCTVGDAQQSIYRFRGADVSVFRNKKEETEQGSAGTSCSLDVNFRSHADILEYADRIFEGGSGNPLGHDFLHLDSCGEDKRKGARAIEGKTMSRRQAVLVAGGRGNERIQLKARAIAQRFARLRAEEGFEPGDMVILMRSVNNADVFAREVRAAGMPCVVSGGSTTFSSAPEVGAISALLAFLANPDDGERGLLPLLTSPMFGLGATELLALSTHIDEQAQIVDSRSLTAEVFCSGELMEAFGDLPLLNRAREVLLRALSRMGHDSVANVVRDVVNESGWMLRLERSGEAQDRAMAANVLKALAIVEAESETCAFAPRLVARAFDNHVTHEKESPATLNGADSNAVRIMTVHASKGLEFPVVAVVGVDGVSADKSRFKRFEEKGSMLWSAFPNRFTPASDKNLLEPPDLTEDELYGPVPHTASAAFKYFQNKNRELDYEESARLLYVALTRAREVCLLVFGATYGTELKCDHKNSLVGEALSRILPEDPDNGGAPNLGAKKLAFPNSREGDFQLIVPADFKFEGNKKVKRVYAVEEFGPEAQLGLASEDAQSDDDVASALPVAAARSASERSFPLVYPADIKRSLLPFTRPPRQSYSYSFVSHELHEVGEDNTSKRREVEEELPTELLADGVAEPAVPQKRLGNANAATNLGSVFHDACQWLIETGSSRVPAARLDALCAYWTLTPEQRVRVEAALERWYGSEVRAEALKWPCMRAEVPFYSLGMDDLTERFAPYAEGAIDLLCTNPADTSCALVIDYKTGGVASETPEQLQEKHHLQAQIYADVLHKQGFEHVTLKFVRVEQPDPLDPAQPQVVTYEL